MPWDEISVQDIAREANVSIGAFYGRFEDKETLLDCLAAVVANDVEALFAPYFNPDQPTKSFQQKLDKFVENVLEFFQKREGLVRALYLNLWHHAFTSHKKFDQTSTDIQDVMRRLVSRVAQQLFDCADCPREIRAEKELVFILNIAVLTARDWVVFDTGGKKDIDLLTNPIDLRLKRMVKGYFGA